MNRLRKFAFAFAAIATGATATLLVTGWGTAVASNISSVFVTNDASHAVPVTQQGTVNVAVDSVVSTHSALPPGQFSWVNGGSAGNVVSGPDPAGTRYAISSITAAMDANTLPSGTTGVDAIAAPDNICQTDGPIFRPLTFGPFISYMPGTTYSLTYPQPYVIEPPTSGDPVCLIVRVIRAGADMSIVGYRF